MNTNSEAIDLFEDVSNPLDNVEEVLSAQDWTFDRLDDDELVVDIEGKHCNYNLHFIWQENFNTLRFSCSYEMALPLKSLDIAHRTLSEINSKLWMGHFDLQNNGRTPCFRHTSLFRGMVYTSGAEHLGDLMEIALFECERHYPIFQLLIHGNHTDPKNIDLAMMDALGES